MCEKLGTGYVDRGYAEQAVNEKSDMPTGPYYSSITKELESRKFKLIMELKLVESALSNLTPEIEKTLQIAKTLEQLGMKTRF